MDQERNIVIVGGGIIGATTAYYLTRHPKFNPSLHTITLLEASSIAAGASGKAGGLLALWAYPQCLVPLSYRLHQELAEQHQGAEKWGYRRVSCGSLGAVVTKGDLEAREAAAEDAAQAKAPAPQPGMSALQADPSSSVQEVNGGANGASVTPSSPIGSCPKAIGDTAPQQDLAAKLTTKGNTGDDDGITTAGSPEAEGATAKSETGDKEWEKLPKQDAAAAALLQDSPLPPDLDWIDRTLVYHYEEMGAPGFTETAQVHPFHFTTAIAELARAAGVDIRLGAKVTNIIHHHDTDTDTDTSTTSPPTTTTTTDETEKDPNKKTKPHTKTVEYQDRHHDNRPRALTRVTDVIVAAGPWTGTLLPRSKIEGLRAHSVVYAADVSPHAVFTDVRLPPDWVPAHRRRRGQKRRRHRGSVDPEIYARPFGEVYACGEPDRAVPLPPTADLVQADPAQCDDLASYIATFSPTLAAAPLRARQACYLPQHVRFGTERGPLLGPTSTPGVWVASGHTCWGVQNAPGTGYLMAEWVLDGAARGAEVGGLHPGKFKV